jgi:hypothetical protein
MNRLRDHYDWLVLGDHPGALLSGALVAKLGLSVLILPCFAGAKIATSKSGQVLDPESNFLIGLSEGLLADCLKHVGVGQKGSEGKESQFQQFNPVLQALTPEKRVACLASAAAFKRELEREFGTTGAKALGMAGAIERARPAVSEYWKSIPERLTLSTDKKPKRGPAAAYGLGDVRRKLERTSSGAERQWFSRSQKISGLARSSKQKSFFEVGEALWSGLSQSLSRSRDDHDPKLFELVHLLAAAHEGGSFRGGLTAYRAMLIKEAERLGAHVASDAECKQLYVERGRLSGVQVSQRGSLIGLSGGVLGCSLSQIANKVSYTARTWPRSLKRTPRSFSWAFTLALSVHSEAIPPGLSARSIWQEQGAAPLEIEIADPADYDIDEPEHRLIFARTWLPLTAQSLSVAYQRMTAARMLRQLTELLPFLEFHIARIFPDFRTENNDFSEVYGFATVDLIPENLRVERGKGSGSGSGLEGLFVATGESYPELGTLGSTIAALEATAWIAHRTGLAGPL